MIHCKKQERVTAHYEDEEGKSAQVVLDEVSPGVYEKEVKLNGNGFYAFNIEESDAKSLKASYPVAFVKQYSKEYKLMEQNKGLDQLIAAVDGKLITTSDEVFKVSQEKSYKRVRLTDLLLMIALLWFLIDVVIRKLNLSNKNLKIVPSSIKEKLTNGHFVKEQHINKNEKLINDKLKTKHHKNESLINERPIYEQKKTAEGNNSKQVVEIQNKVQKPKKQNKEKAQEHMLDTAALLKSQKERRH